MTHRHGTGADKTFPARAQAQALNRPSGRIRSIQNPHRLAVTGGGFQYIAQGGDEGVDAATEILQIDQQHIKVIHHGRGRSPHRAIQAEHRNAMTRIDKVRRLDHVVLFVAAQAMLGAESGG